MQVRSYRPSDHDALRALFARAGEGSPTATLWQHPESEADLYLEPYLRADPDSVFLALVDGVPVGYLTGCLDSGASPNAAELMARVIKEHRLISRRGPAIFFARSVVDLVSARLRRVQTAAEGFSDPRWPAHLHINVAPEARRSGAGRALMEAWFDRLRARRVPGCYLQTVVQNERAIGFFERMGFIKHGPTPEIPGLRYRGARVHQQTMVRAFDTGQGPAGSASVTEAP
ncbi:GCN5 family acetyltransferase [Sorangium cellulosum]|uniref:GCN5 family acetyltransferase n=1 Tax=Sorangium cellulosum TaxID=56 RepID=A0A150PTE9_SORCE|nr:GCN5 family acetyltransferase [Sorangium cellulosum]